MRHSLYVTLLIAVVACSASTVPCGFGAEGLEKHCCNLEAHGFDADDSTSIRWLRAQIDTPEFYPLTCDWLHQMVFDSIGRKMSRVGCWGRTIQIDGVSFEMLTCMQLIELMHQRHCSPF